MSQKFKKGEKVAWKWGQGTADGKVEKIYTEKISCEISGSTITRNASKEEPAYLIVQDDGQKVLKSQSEIEKAA